MKVTEEYESKTHEGLTKNALKSRWAYVSGKAKEVKSQHKKAKILTGGGPNPKQPPSDLDNLVLDASGETDMNFARSYDQESTLLKQRFAEKRHQHHFELD